MKTFEPSQSLWGSRQQECPSCTSRSGALQSRRWQGDAIGVATETAAQPQQLRLCRSESSARHRERLLSSRQGWQGPCLRLSHLPTRVQAQAHTACSLLPPFSSDNAHRGHSSPITSIQVPLLHTCHALWQLFSLFECSGQGYSLEAEVFYWSSFHCRGSFDIHLLLQTQRELEMLYNLYRPRKDHSRVFCNYFFPPGNRRDSEGTCHTGESSTRWIIAVFGNAALTLLSSSLPLWYPQQENCCETYCILEKSPFWLKSPFRINFYCSLIHTPEGSIICP